MLEKPKSFGKELITMAKQTTIRTFFFISENRFLEHLHPLKIFTEKTKYDGCRKIAADPFKNCYAQKGSGYTPGF